MADYCDVGEFRCKYCYKGVCDFFAMGSGDVHDMPCANRRNYSFDEMPPNNTINISREEFSTQGGLCIEYDMSNLTKEQKSLLYEYGRRLMARLFDEVDKDV